MIAALMSSLIPPLLGDGAGRYRIKVVGNSGAGKSTLVAQLGTLLGLPTLHLDRVFWLPDWEQVPTEEFRAKVRAFLDSAPDGWIIDGNYESKLGDLVESAATDIIWLDPPFALYFPRIVWRTLLRLFRLGPPCAPGCDERISEVFSLTDQSIIYWCWTHHDPMRTREGGKIDEDIAAGEELKVTASGTRVGRRRRISGWGSEYRTFITEVEDMARST